MNKFYGSWLIPVKGEQHEGGAMFLWSFRDGIWHQIEKRQDD